MIIEEKFSLEVELRDLIARNISIASKIITDPELIGVEYPAGKWFIDLLYRDANKNYVVIELKKESSSDKTVGQIQRYMTWVRENLAEDGAKVRGVIICGSDDDRLAYAIRSVIDVVLVVYSIDISLHIVPNHVGYNGCMVKTQNTDYVFFKPKAKRKPVSVIKKITIPVFKRECGADYSRQLWNGKIYKKNNKILTNHHSFRHGKSIVTEMSWGGFWNIKADV